MGSPTRGAAASPLWGAGAVTLGGRCWRGATGGGWCCCGADRVATGQPWRGTGADRESATGWARPVSGCKRPADVPDLFENGSHSHSHVNICNNVHDRPTNKTHQRATGPILVSSAPMQTTTTEPGQLMDTRPTRPPGIPAALLALEWRREQRKQLALRPLQRRTTGGRLGPRGMSWAAVVLCWLGVVAVAVMPPVPDLMPMPSTEVQSRPAD
jgi:hypothetical protein